MSRVLVVDDCADTTASLSFLLALWGHEVLAASDGASAVELAPGFRPDAALLDLCMPGMDGYEVAARLRSMPAARGALLVALTGLDGELSRRRAHDAGFHVYLPKPVEPDELRALLACCLNSGQ
jgi:CheY-like chemotaxis protein